MRLPQPVRTKTKAVTCQDQTSLGLLSLPPPHLGIEGFEPSILVPKTSSLPLLLYSALNFLLYNKFMINVLSLINTIIRTEKFKQHLQNVSIKQQTQNQDDVPEKLNH